MLPDFGEIFTLDVNALDLFIRASVIYLGLLFTLRVIGRRETGNLELPELLMIVLIADGVQNGMAGNYQSLPGGLIVGGTIIGWNYALTLASYRWPRFGRVVRPPALTLIENGNYLRKNMRREMITSDELDGLLRLQGIEDTSEVRRAYLEPDGELSVLKKEGKDNDTRPHRKSATT